jgi:hypothetical protein
MKYVLILVTAALFLSGCDNITRPSQDSGFNYLPYLQTLNKISVRFSANTLQHSFIDQGSLDPGVTQDIWLPRELCFENLDSLYTIEWIDSTFQTKACFAYEQIDPIYGLSDGCGDRSYIHGTYHADTKSISNVVCYFEQCIGCQDPDNYKAEHALLRFPELSADTYGDDSLVFSAKDIKGISAEYSDEEVYQRTWIKKIQMTGFDTLSTQFPVNCKVTFFKK